MKRKKRLKRGIESLEEQIEIHKEKLREASEDGNEELVQCYEKDLVRLEKEKDNKKRHLDQS